MTLAEAIAAFERDFVVSPLVGSARDDGVLDRDRAPSGERYAVLTSGGVRGGPGGSGAWFEDEEDAVAAWLKEAWAYAEKRGGKTLYWRDMPVFCVAEFVALDQPGVMRDIRTRHSINLNIGFVYSRLLVSTAEQEAVKEGKQA